MGNELAGTIASIQNAPPLTFNNANQPTQTNSTLNTVLTGGGAALSGIASLVASFKGTPSQVVTNNNQPPPAETNDNTMMYVVGGVLVFIVVGLTLFLIFKK